MRTLIAAALLLAAATTAVAQEQVIDPGMTRDQVEEILGKPVGVRSTGTFIYMFFPNGCEIRCGMQDLVILQDGAVVDAVFRRPGRRYSGASSSPAGVKAEPTLGPIRIEPPSSAPLRGGGVISAPPDTGTVATPARAPTVPGITVPGITVPAAGAAPAATAAEVKPTPGPGGVPLNPADTITTRQAPARPGSLVPATPQSTPVPNAGSRPNPADSAAKARAGNPPATP